ncbi:hypothetical protein KGD82_15810 [Nocardiopsis eucommiae]|uniref:Uncharacterized protein n=1 Tax=Nocardiopsis eucommiae TaxID=2831970 RepID=A0A975L5L9_9ACTN|nr:hypothetical protein KGD82_15810 [Nocardiopsis eucommiae]
MADGDAEGEEEIWEDPLLDTVFHAALRDLWRAAPTLLGAVRPLLTHADGRVRQRAVTTTGALCRLVEEPEVDLSGAADLAENRDEGAAIVLALVEGGGDTTSFLAHPDQAIRACAALSEGLAGDPVAVGELRAALLDPAAADAWFRDRPGYFPGHVRFSLVDALVSRSGSEDAADLLPVFRELAATAGPFSCEADLRGLLRLALGARRVPPHPRSRPPPSSSAPTSGPWSTTTGSGTRVSRTSPSSCGASASPRLARPWRLWPPPLITGAHRASMGDLSVKVRFGGEYGDHLWP